MERRKFLRQSAAAAVVGAVAGEPLFAPAADQADAARKLGDRKAANVLATGAQIYASANPGCLVQVSNALRRAGRPLPALHPIELLDASIRGTEAAALRVSARR